MVRTEFGGNRHGDGFVGTALTLQQRDIKRVLAYSSIENVGLIAVSLGIGVWGQATHRPIVAALGVTGALLHVWNHAAMKSLMFLAAGSILHETGTRDMDQMGGLVKRMPWTAGAMTVGAVAIAALPTLNGFTSKWLMYLAVLQCGLSPASDQGLAALLSIGLPAPWVTSFGIGDEKGRSRAVLAARAREEHCPRNGSMSKRTRGGRFMQSAISNLRIA